MDNVSFNTPDSNAARFLIIIICIIIVIIIRRKTFNAQCSAGKISGRAAKSVNHLAMHHYASCAASIAVFSSFFLFTRTARFFRVRENEHKIYSMIIDHSCRLALALPALSLG